LAAAPPAAHNPSSANASAPLSLTPGGAQPDPAPTRTAAANPVQTAPAPSAGGGYVVQVSSQKSESDAQASFRALQGKFPAVLGSRSPVIKRADLGDKGIYYRAMVGPFGSPDEASQFCGSLKTAGGQCVVQRN
jgi:cell division septation protein DedD